MSKKQILDEFTNVLAVALRHKIGSMVNPNAIYAERYAKDSETLFKQAEKTKEQITWNYNDKIEIKQELIRKLKKELEKKDFLANEKYNYVDSEINKGTSFIITLPIDKKSYSQEEESQYLIVQEEKTTPPLIDSLEVSEEWNIKKHGNEVPLILLVEDETDLRRYVASRLSCRFRILEACNGKEALVLAEKHSPDLILCDNIMPEMDGIKFCNEIKSRKNLNLIPLVFLSAWTSDDFKLEGLKSGADDYISKPFNFDILETKISNIIHNRKIYLEIARRMIKVEPNDHKIKTIDEQFILKAQSIIERNLDNSDFSTKNFEDELNMSHSAVYRKLKELTGLAANEFIREYKLRRAAQILIQDKNLTIFEVCQMVGISDAKYFSHCFKKLFGDTPSDYLRKNSPLVNTEFRVVQ